MARGKTRRTWGCNESAGPGRRRIRYWADLGDGRGYRRVSETIEGTRRDADQVLAERRVEHSGDAPSPTVGAVWERWVRPTLAARAADGEISPGTLSHYDAAWERQVAPRWARVQATDVRRADVQAWYDGMTRSQAQMARIVLRAIFDECELREIAPASIGRYRYRMPRGGEVRDRGIWTLDELRRVWEASADTPMEAWLVLSAFGGPRVGESLGARVEEAWRWDGGPVPVAVVPIVRQAERDGTVTTRLKTASSSHAAVVPGPMGARLLRLCEEAGEGWVLPGRRPDEPMLREALRQRFEALLREAGVERHPLRNLRNSWETYTHWTLGVEPEKVERMMGHAGKGVTERHYDRPEAESLAAEAARAYALHPFADGWGVREDGSLAEHDK